MFLPKARIPLTLAALALIAAAIALVLAPAAPGEGADGPALAALGRRLLAEPRLAADGATNCMGCHRPERGYTDGRATAAPGGLNTPPLWGLGARAAFGWFSPEVTSLEAMVLRPLADPAEMGPRADATLDRLRADPALAAAYRAAFPRARRLVTWEQTARALAAAIRAIPAPPSPYGQLGAGGAPALPPAARRGAALFSELGCAACHRPPAFASDTYHNVGVSADTRRNGGAARVPSLRGARRTAPYFHDGSAATLADVVRAYAQGGQAPGADTSPAITPLQLTEQDVRDLVAFLEGL